MCAKFFVMENPPKASEHVAANVKRLRKERGWTLAQLSAQLEEAGHRLGVPVLSKIELGDRGIDVDDLAAFARVFEVDPASLLDDPAIATCEALSRLWGQYRDAERRRRRAAEEANAELRAIAQRVREVVDAEDARDVLEQVIQQTGASDRQAEFWAAVMTEEDDDGER
jgi:transcriptional regulator with XRE-family HTH domain